MAASPTVQPGTPPPNAPSLDDFYVPAYRLFINGKEIEGKKDRQLVPDIVSVTFHDSLTDVDSVDLVVNNWDPGDPVSGQAVQGKFRYHNTHIFDPWQDIEVWMGYYRQGKDELEQMMLGEISSMAPNFPASGGSTLTVRGLSFLHQFRIQQTSLQFPNMTDSEIAKKIVDEINAEAQKKVKNIKIEMSKDDLKANKALEKDKRHKYLEMHNQYPIVFLMQRSREIGYEISTTDTTAKKDKNDKKPAIRLVTFHYGPSQSVTRPTYVLVWGRSLISFQPSVQTARQVNAVTVNGWNPLKKQPISATATRADLVKKNLRVIAPEDLGMAENQLAQKKEIVVDRPFNNAKDAQAAAEAALLQLAQGLVEAKGKTIGLPLLRAGAKVRICMNPLDIDPTRPAKDQDVFSGMYQVTETTHTINDSGYTTDFSCRMETKS